MTASVAAAPASASASAAAGPLVDLRAPSSSTRVAYAGPALALAVVGVPLYVFVPKFHCDVGYVPNGEQSPQVVTTLRVLYALVPSLCNVAGMAMALSYPIDEARHREILEAIAARRCEQEARGGGATALSPAAEPA